MLTHISEASPSRPATRSAKQKLGLVAKEQLATGPTTDFPRLFRGRLETLQVNLGYRCNQSCAHCHVAAGPKRTEVMRMETIAQVLHFVRRQRLRALDLTGGAPELNPGFRFLVSQARSLGVDVTDRCNLTVLEEPGHETLARFLAAHEVKIVASLPCYIEENVDNQRGAGAYRKSLNALRKLNALGYGAPDGRLSLDLVYNPLGPYLAPPQRALEATYKAELLRRHGVSFNRLLTIANMPIARFAKQLLSSGSMNSYLTLLRSSHQEANLEEVMCKRMISIDWEGTAYDCDFNQMLGMTLAIGGRKRSHLRQLLDADFRDGAIQVGSHCYGCTAGQGSGCNGALAPFVEDRSLSIRRTVP